MAISFSTFASGSIVRYNIDSNQVEAVLPHDVSIQTSPSNPSTYEIEGVSGGKIQIGGATKADTTAGTISGNNLTFSFPISFNGIPGAGEIKFKVSPGGLVPHPTDPNAAPIPSVNISSEMRVGPLSFDLPIKADNITTDNIFDPEVPGSPLSGGLLGDAYNKIRHRQREIDAAVDAAANGTYRRAVTYRPHDPLAIDLDGDGDGIETVGITANPILFDHNGDGIRTGTGWLKGDDAWLVRDLNGNGQIDSGAELFGVDTVVNGTLGPRTASSGFEALVALDTGDGSATTTAAGYKDNVFDAKDAAFSQVRLWQDLNQNGISEANELSTLADKGIVSISLAVTSDTTNLGNGNTITGKASVTRTTGTTTIDSVAVTSESAGNLGLATNGFYRAFNDSIPLTDTAKVLPEMRGSGFVRDLREAASLSPELAGVVAQFAQATTRADQIALIDSLLESWAKSSGKYDAPDVLEALNKTVIGESSTQLFVHLTTMDPAEAEIVKNSHSLWSAISFAFQNSSPYTTREYSSTSGLLVDVVNAKGMEILRQKSVLEVFNGARFVDLNQTTTKPNSTGMAGGGGGGGGGGVMPTEGPLVEFGMVISDIQAGLITQAYETLRESVYSGLLLQTRLAPYLDAVQLVIDDQGIHFDASALDTKFNQAVATNQQEAMLDLLDLNLYAQDTLQAVGFNGVQKLKGWLDGLATDSPIWSTLTAAGLLPTGTKTGTVYRDLGFGQDTAEMLYLGSGNDLVFAQGGNDFVFGEDGEDTLDGGAGNDYLSGGNGADTYLFGRGSGQDTIGNSDNDAAGTAPDTVQLQYDVAPSDVKLTRSGDALIITINGTADSLRVESYFNADGNTPYAVDHIKFSDFTVWDVDAVKAIVQMGTTGNDTIYGYAVGDTISAGSGNDTVYGYAGADLIDGGKGKDSLEGGEGADTLIGGAGNDALYGGNGSDTYVFGRGAGQDTIYNFDNDGLNVNADSIQVETGIAPSDVTLTRYTDDLYVRINGTDDILCVSGYFSADATAPNAVEQIVFSDSTVWDIATVKARVQVGTEGNDTLYGYAVGDTISAGNGNDTIYGYNGSDQLVGGSGRDNLQGAEGDDTLYGGAGADWLDGGNGEDSLQGNEGNDIIYGYAGNDTLDGGSGNDVLSGGNGADIYLFGEGSGQDTVSNSNSDNDAVGVNADTILLGAGINTTDVTLTRVSDDLLIGINGTDDSLRVSSYFSAEGTTSNVVENIQFANSTVWDVSTVKSKVQTSTTGNDTLYGYALNDTLSAGDGNDTVYGNNGNDQLSGDNGRDSLQGGEGDDTLYGGYGSDLLYGGNGQDSLQGNEGGDTLYGEDGNDTLDGGLSNDVLVGGSGADIYLFGKGAGQDTINNSYGDGDALGVNADTILLGDGITPTDVTLTRVIDDLLICINGTDDSLRVSGYFNADGATNNAVENIKFANSTVWGVATVKSKVQTSTTGNDTLYGYALNDTLSAGDGNDTIFGNGGSDQLNGGNGRDNLQGGEGDDTLYGGFGSDLLYGGNGQDSLQGNENDDTLYGEDGNDTLDGGLGNDVLKGGNGADTYLFGIGSGQDTVRNDDNDAVGVNTDTILLGDGITTTDVTLTRVSDDLILSLNGTDDSLRVADYFKTDGATSNVVENIKFANSTVWDYAAVKSRLSTATTPQGVTLNGTSIGETLTGGSGNDILHGNGGNDTLDGGVGNDYLGGEAGNDTFLFGLGYGKDTVNAYDTTAGKLDVVNLGSGIGVADVSVSRSGTDLLLKLNGRSDNLTISSYFNNDAAGGNQVEQIKFADTTVWDVNTIKTKVLAATSGNDILTGYSTGDTIVGLAGDDTIHGMAGGDSLDGGAGEDSISGDEGSDTIYGGAQNDKLSGDAGADSLFGDAGDDYLYGGSENDTLDGGAGNDYLSGDAGNDTYVFGLGYGKDTISSNDTTVGKFDVATLGAGISAADVTVSSSASGTDLVLTINGTSDSLTISGYFNKDAASGSQVEQIRFADTTIWDVNTIKAKALNGTANGDTLTGYSSSDTITGLAGDDTIRGMAGGDSLDGGAGEDSISGDEGADTIYGGAQNDKLSGDAGADSLFGDAGDDVLYGGSENDTLDGGAGNDYLSGDAGNDTYIFGLGYGKDTISSNDTTVGKFDVVSLEAGISVADVTVSSSASGTDLLLTINGTSDSLTISAYFNKDAAGGNQVEQIKFADTTIWDVNTIKAMALNGTANGDTLTGYSSSDTISGLGDDDSIHGMDGGDSLYGGEGDDKLYGDAGADTIYGGSQNDLISGDAGADSLFGDAGDDVLYGGADNDTLDGGAGSDTLNGDAGNDTYVFAAGSGKDSIAIDNDTSSNKLNTLNLSTGISAGGLSFDRSGDDLVIARSGSSDSITINQFFLNNDPANTKNPIQQVQILEEGVTWSNSTVQRLASATLANDTTTGTAVADKIYGLDNGDTLTGLDGADFLFGNGGADSLSGGADADWLFGGSGADTLNGGTGADTMVGGRNDDYYYVDSADDVVIEQAYADDFSSYDQIESSVSYTAPDNVEAITLTGATDINATSNNNGCDLNGNAGNNYLKGGDGLDFIFGDEGVDTLEGGAGDDYYYLTSNEDTVIEQAGGGLDQIWAYGDGIRMADNVERLYMQSYLARTAYGNNSNNVMGGNNRANTLYGNGGNDRLFGYNGDDTLYGGQGNDSLYGSVGNDVYHVQRGDGQDLISDFDMTVGAKDRLIFDGAVDSSQIWLARSGNDLVLSIIGTSDKVTIGSWYVSNDNKVESITASGNGKTLDYTKVDALVSAMAGFTPPVAGQTTLPQAYQDQLAGVIAANWG